MKLRPLLFVAAAVTAAPSVAQTPVVAVSQDRSAGRCEALPIGGTGSAGSLTIGGSEARRDLRLNGRPVERLPRDVAAVTVRAACHGSGSDYFLLGVATTVTAPACALRYQIAEVVGGRIRLSPRFGSCADGAAATLGNAGLIVTMPAGPGNPANIAYRYSSGRISAVAAPAPRTIIAAPAPERRHGRAYQLAAWVAPPACAIAARETAISADAPAADILLASFQRDWPHDWRTRGRLRDQPFSNAALRAVVTDLACLSALPGGERVVARAARPLFESGRHGKRAFEQLDEVARGAAINPGVRAAARVFHAQMRYEVDREHVL